MQTIILVGGLGTRLAHIVPDIPKPMASINGRPFLDYVLTYLHGQGVASVIMAVGYKHECIMNYYGGRFLNMSIAYSIEDEPLGTGGAMKKALQACTGNQVVIINGDTYFEVDLEKMASFHKAMEGDVTIATKYLENFDRYGTVKSENGRIISFVEKKHVETGRINGGVYIIKKDILTDFYGNKFSFENDFMEKELRNTKIMEFPADGYFIDIGVPEDYGKAQVELAGML